MTATDLLPGPTEELPPDPRAGSATAVATTRIRAWQSEWQDRWRLAPLQARTRIQVAVLVGSVAVAYHYSLATLLQSLNLDTPLAYVGLVPFIALGLAAVRSRPVTAEPSIHDRQVDYIIGVPLLATALAINVLLPRRMSAMFWVWRMDLLSLPFFVAGVAAIIFGVRALWRQRLAMGYLFLAWPLPYSAVLLGQLNAVTSVTLHALHAIVRVVHVGAPAPLSDGSVFNIVHHGKSFPLGVVSACSGVNGMVGFLLVGTAFSAIVSGPWLRKTLWLLGGLLLLWALNLGRLILIFWVGQEFGEHFAIKVLHPFVGLVTFNIGIVIMLFLLRPAGLRIGGIGKEGGRPAATGTGIAGTSVVHAVPRVYSAIALVVGLGLVLGGLNAGLRTYDLVARADGEPKLASFLAYPGSPSGWRATFSTEYDFARPFFGESSSWYRYTFGPTLGPSDLHNSAPVVADVINTSNLSSFSAYGVEACYRFHGYSLRSVTQISLGGGITGQALSYSSARDHQDWSIVYWIWPVRKGTTTRYERVILYALNTGFGTVAAPGVGRFTNAQSNSAAGVLAQSGAERAFLIAFAREIVQAQAVVPIGTTLGKNSPDVGPRPAALNRPAFLDKPARKTEALAKP